MEDRILDYYERELTFIREMGAEFAKKYPKIAGRLMLEGDKCEDPHTERLIEAFALISGRIHKKIDDDFPEITEALLSIIYPHYITPIPSMSVVQFDPIVQNIPPAGYRIAKETPLFSNPVGGAPCQFRTCYPVVLWPVEVAAAEIREPLQVVPEARQVIALRLKILNDLRLAQLEWRKLRFYLNAPAHQVHHLYELLFNHVCRIECEIPGSRGRKENLPWPRHRSHRWVLTGRRA